jgi:hypothetical protein
MVRYKPVVFYFLRKKEVIMLKKVLFLVAVLLIVSGAAFAQWPAEGRMGFYDDPDIPPL